MLTLYTWQEREFDCLRSRGHFSFLETEWNHPFLQANAQGPRVYFPGPGKARRGTPTVRSFFKNERAAIGARLWLELSVLDKVLGNAFLATDKNL
ncbi:hypothetical protein AVEN_75176-1 [Araneus ventricosus]|uniref:Uncharacterized protein n=1 Tax=Araneus ventricosus TaxID=182803 RepID=A0A4Y2T907_ARAVE|nr:hypothetical protein AVEN_75176-1 [Araneus ventricosus]